jgi:hypothetical protein
VSPARYKLLKADPQYTVDRLETRLLSPILARAPGILVGSRYCRQTL